MLLYTVIFCSCIVQGLTTVIVSLSAFPVFGKYYLCYYSVVISLLIFSILTYVIQKLPDMPDKKPVSLP